MTRVLKFFAKFALACFILACLFWTLTFGTLQTKQGQDWATKHLIAYLEKKTQTQIQIGKIHFAFPLDLHLEEVSISQDHLPIVSIQDLDIRCSFTHMLQGKLVFSKVQAFNIAIQRLSHHSEHTKETSSRPWDAPLLPFYVKLENIDIKQVKLGESLIQTLALPHDISQIAKESSLNFQGMISNNPFRGSITAHLLITAKSEHSDLTPYSLGIDTQNHHLSLSFHCHHFPLHSFAAEIPATLKAHLALYAAAPVSSWQHLAQNTSPQDRAPIEGHFKLSLTSPEEETPFFSSLVGAQTSLRGRYVVKSTAEIEFLDLKLNHPDYQLEGDVILTDHLATQHTNFKGKIENLARFQTLLGKQIEGQLNLEGHLAGPLHSPFIIVYCDSPRLLISQQVFQNVRSSIQAASANQAWNGLLTLSLDYQNTLWNATSSFNWDREKQLRLYQLQGDAMRSHLEGDITYHAFDSIWEGNIEAEMNNFNDIAHFFNVPISGNGQIQLQFTAAQDEKAEQRKQIFHAKLMGQGLQWIDLKAQQFTLNLTIDPLQKEPLVLQVQSDFEGQQVGWKDYFVQSCQIHSIHEIHLADQSFQHFSTEWEAQAIRWPTGQAAHVKGQARLRNPLEMIEGNIQFHAEHVQTEMARLDELEGSGHFDLNQTEWPFQLKGRGFWKDHFRFFAKGNWHLQKEKFELHTHQLTGEFGPYLLQLLEPLHVTRHLNGLQVTGLHLQLGEGKIQGQFNLDQQNVFSTFKTNAVPSELFHYFMPDLPLTGRATFQGQLSGPIQDPRGKLQIDLHNIQVIEDIFAKKPFIAGKLYLDLSGKGIQVSSELKGIGHTPLLISGQLPISLSLDPVNFKIDPNLPFKLALNAEGELDPYLHLFYNDTTNLSGQAKIALQLTGQMMAPQIQGHIDLINGAYESLSTGAIYHNIQAHLEGNGSKIVLSKFSAQDNKQGSITAAGTITLDASKRFPFEFNINPSHIFILDSDYASISASGPLSLIGNMEQSKLRGELTIDRAIVHLEETLPRKVKTVDVKYINLAEGERQPNYLEKKEGKSSIELDIKLQAPQNISIEANHLKSEWKGSIAVTGTPNNIQLYGDLRIARGEYDFNGKVFTLSQGNIHFAGSPDKKTTLYVVASKDIDRIHAEIIVKGPATKPVISFRSNPPLSQREVLSYILFNRGISDITSDQGDQLSQSFISLQSSDQTKASDDFLSRLRNNIGIDRLDFISSNRRLDPTRPNYDYERDNQDIGLQIGKNLTENISVSVNQSMAAPPSIAIEAKLRKNLKAQAESGVNSDAPVRMSIKWKKDY